MMVNPRTFTQRYSVVNIPESANIIAKISLENDNPQFFFSHKFKLMAIIHRQESVSLYTFELVKLWNLRVRNLIPIDVIFGPNGKLIGIAFKPEDKDETTKYHFRIVLIKDHLTVLNNIELSLPYICGTWIEYKSEATMFPLNAKFDNTQVDELRDIMKEVQTQGYELQTLFNKCYDDTTRSFLYNKISPDNVVTSLIGDDDKQPPTMLVLITKGKIKFYINGYRSIISIRVVDLAKFVLKHEVIRSVILNDNFTKLVLFFSKYDNQSDDSHTILLGSLKKLKWCETEPVPSVVGDLLFKYGQYMCTLAAIVEEIDKTNFNLEKFLDVEFFDFIRDLNSEFPSGFIGILIEMLLYGVSQQKFRVILTRFIKDNVLDRLVADLPKIKNYWKHLSRQQQLLEMLLINTHNLKLLVTKVMIQKSIFGSEKHNSQIDTLFNTFEETIEKELTESYVIFQLQQRNQYIDGIEQLYTWLMEFGKQIGTSQDIISLSTTQNFAYGPFGTSCDRMQFLAKFLGHQLVDIVDYVINGGESILSRKLNVINIKSSLKKLSDYLRKLVSNELFTYYSRGSLDSTHVLKDYLLTENYIDSIFFDRNDKKYCYHTYNHKNTNPEQILLLYNGLTDNIPPFQLLTSNFVYDPMPKNLESGSQNFIVLHAIRNNNGFIGTLKTSFRRTFTSPLLPFNDFKFIFKNTTCPIDFDSPNTEVYCTFNYLFVYQKLDGVVYVYDNSSS